MTIPIRMKTEGKDYIRKMITVSLVDRDDELFLCGLKTLIEWKEVAFYENILTIIMIGYREPKC